MDLRTYIITVYRDDDILWEQHAWRGLFHGCCFVLVLCNFLILFWKPSKSSPGKNKKTAYASQGNHSDLFILFKFINSITCLVQPQSACWACKNNYSKSVFSYLVGIQGVHQMITGGKKNNMF